MLTARRISSTTLENVQCLSRLHAWEKTIVIKGNGDFDIYTNEGLHTYRKLWKEPVFEALYSDSLSTLFVQCERSLILFSVGNMEQYDKIVDKRGISKFWCLERSCNQEVDKKTVIVVLLRTKVPRLKFYTWIARKFSKLVEVALSRRNEVVQSVALVDQGSVVTTSHGIYFWKFGSSTLTSVEKVLSPKWPESLSSSLDKLSDITSRIPKNDAESSTDSLVWSSFGSIWPLDKVRNKRSKNLVCMFQPNDDQCVILDGRSEKLLEFHCTNQGFLYLSAISHEKFFCNNPDFTECLYLGSNFVVLHNNNILRIVDYENGFPYLDLEVSEGIKKIYQHNENEIMIWTNDNVVDIYRIDVDEKVDIKKDSLTENIFELNFDILEKRVVFYKGILKSRYISRMNITDQSTDLIDLYTMRLRDLYIIYALQAFDRAQKIYQYTQVDEVQTTRILYDRIIRKIFDIFIEFLAPPELIITYCFPSTLDMINQLFGLQEYFFHKSYKDVPANLIRKSFLPYLTEIRRHIRNISQKKKTYWTYNNASHILSIEFFESHKNRELSVNELLKLIDTVLFKMYLLYNKPMVGSLVRVDNECDFDVVEASLKKENMIHELIDFYFFNNKHDKALTLLTDLMNSSGEMQQKIKTLIVDYLKKLELTNLDLVLEYSDYLLDKFPDECFDILSLIFLHSLSFSKQLPHDKIYEYIDSKRSDVSLAYLEFVIGELQCTNTKMFCILIKRYLKNIDDAKVLRKLHAVLKSAQSYDYRAVFKILKGAIKEAENCNSSHLKAIKYLLPYPLKKMGENEEALKVLWDELNDYQLSSDYCSNLYSGSTELGVTLLMSLLNRILKNSHNEPKYSLLKLFLAEHGPKLNPEEVLETLPDEIQISDISKYLSMELKKETTEQNNVRLMRNILHAEIIKTNHNLAEVISEFFILSEERKCPICSKLLSGSNAESLSIFTYKGKSYVMHSNCGKKLQNKREHDEKLPTLKTGLLLSELA